MSEEVPQKSVTVLFYHFILHNFDKSVFFQSDILEAMGVHTMPGVNHSLSAFMSNSLHIAPGLTQNIPRAKETDELHFSDWYSISILCNYTSF